MALGRSTSGLYRYRIHLRHLDPRSLLDAPFAVGLVAVALGGLLASPARERERSGNA